MSSGTQASIVNSVRIAIQAQISGAKEFFVATLITTEGIVPKYKKRRFSAFNNQILAFKVWLPENNCRDVCMESTGKYWVPVYNLLEDSINVTIANPKWVSAVKSNKDDA